MLTTRLTEKGKFKGKCHNCRKVGHRAADCWDDDANASKSPKNYKKSEAALAGTELMLCTVIAQEGCPYCARAWQSKCYGCKYGQYELVWYHCCISPSLFCIIPREFMFNLQAVVTFSFADLQNISKRIPRSQVSMSNKEKYKFAHVT
jgi:hypothetical protein